MKCSPLLLAVLTLCGCSLTGDDDAWPPTVEQVQAELGAPPRGTMRIKDYDSGEVYESKSVYYVKYNGDSCDLDILWRYKRNDESIYNSSFSISNPNSCDLKVILNKYPNPYMFLYPLTKYYEGSFVLIDDSTIRGVYVLKSQADGFLPATRRVAGTFTARRVACRPDSWIEGACAP